MIKYATALLYLVLACHFHICAKIVDGPIINPENKHTYFLVGPGSWTDCQAEAVEMGGNLVTIESAAENAWIIATFGGQWHWIGLSDVDHEGVFSWVSGSKSTYRNWAPGEPNNYWTNSVASGEDFVGFYYNSQWNDFTNERQFDGGLANQFGVVELDFEVPIPDIEIEATPGLKLIDGVGRVDFGDTPIGEKRRVQFAIKNPSKAKLSNLAIESDGSSRFSVSKLTFDALSPGEVGYFTVEYNPITIGKHTRNIRVISNVPGLKRQFDIVVQGTGVGVTNYDLSIVDLAISDSFDATTKISVSGVTKSPILLNMFWVDKNGKMVGEILDSWTLPVNTGGTNVTHVTGLNLIANRNVAASSLTVQAQTDNAPGEINSNNNKASIFVPRIFLASAGVRWPANTNSVGLAGDIDAEDIKEGFGRTPFVYQKIFKMNSSGSGNKSAILDYLKTPPAECTAGDTFVFYLSSHGDFFEKDGGEAIQGMTVLDKCPPAGVCTNTITVFSTGDEYITLGSETIVDDELADILFSDAWTNINKLIILDSCYSGGFWDSHANGDGDLRRLSKIGFIAASTEGEFSYSTDSGRGVFTRAVVLTLLELSGTKLRFNDLAAGILAKSKDKTFVSEKDNLFVMTNEQYWHTPVTGKLSPMFKATADFDLNGPLRRPRIVARVSAGKTQQLILAWGLGLDGYVLQSSPFPDGPWSEEHRLNSEADSVTREVAGGSKYFRLWKP